MTQGKESKGKKPAKKKSSQAPADQAKKSSKDSSGSKSKSRDSSKRRSSHRGGESSGSRSSQVARTAPVNTQDARTAPGNSQVARTAPDASHTTRTAMDDSQAINKTTDPALPANPVAQEPTTIPIDLTGVSVQIVDSIDPDQPGPSGLPRPTQTHLELDTSHGEASAALRDILLASDSGSISVRDFEGFAEPTPLANPAQSRRSRSRSRSRRSHKSRRYRSSSRSSSSDSPSPRRRKRRRHGSGQENSEALSQILTLLSTMVQPTSSLAQPPDRSRVDPHPQSDPAQGAQAPAQVPEGPVSDESALSDREQEGAELLSIGDAPVSDGDVRDSGSDDEPLYGTDIPQDVFERAVDILRRQLGFDVSDRPQEPPSKSKLSLNKPSGSSRASLPVDAECEDRYKATASTATSKRWTAFSKSQNSLFRVDETEWKNLFRTPPLPQAAEDYLRSVGSMDFSGKLKSVSGRRTLQSLYQIDTAARTGLKYSSALLLIAEVLSKSFRQSGASEVSRRDTATLVSLVGPIARRVYDQLCRVSVRSVLDRREIVLDNMRLPAREIRRRFLQLPISGEDLFGGQFDNHLQTEVKRKKDMQKANLSAPRFRPNQPRQRPAPSQRRRQPPPQSSAPNRSPQRGFRSQRQQRRPFGRNPVRGSFKSSTSGRGRGFAKP